MDIKQWEVGSGQWAEGGSVRHRTSISQNFDIAKFDVFYKVSISQSLKFHENLLASMSGTLAMAVTFCASTVID